MLIGYGSSSCSFVFSCCRSLFSNRNPCLPLPTSTRRGMGRAFPQRVPVSVSGVGASHIHAIPIPSSVGHELLVQIPSPGSVRSPPPHTHLRPLRPNSQFYRHKSERFSMDFKAHCGISPFDLDNAAPQSLRGHVGCSVGVHGSVGLCAIPLDTRSVFIDTLITVWPLAIHRQCRHSPSPWYNGACMSI